MPPLAPEAQKAGRTREILHLLLLAVMAFILAVTSQGWPEQEPDCNGTACDES